MVTGFTLGPQLIPEPQLLLPNWLSFISFWHLKVIFLKSQWQSNMVSVDVHWHGFNIVTLPPYTCIDISFCFDIAMPHLWICADDM